MTNNKARRAQAKADAIINKLTDEELAAARDAVRTGLESIERGNYVTYEGRAGLARLASEVKARGRLAIASKTPPA